MVVVVVAFRSVSAFRRTKYHLLRAHSNFVQIKYILYTCDLFLVCLCAIEPRVRGIFCEKFRRRGKRMTQIRIEMNKIGKSKEEIR